MDYMCWKFVCELSSVLCFFTPQNGNIDPVESLSYFHPNITKEDAVQRLGQGKKFWLIVEPCLN